MSWARLLKRVFDIDIDHWPNCGAALKIIAAIEVPPAFVKILSHLGLPNPRPAAVIRFIPNDLSSRKRLPTQADAAKRNTSHAADRRIDRVDRSNNGIFIKQK
jgi:hypothetical protein